MHNFLAEYTLGRGHNGFVIGIRILSITDNTTNEEEQEYEKES